MTTTKKFVTPLILASLVSACSSYPEKSINGRDLSFEPVTKDMVSTWNRTPGKTLMPRLSGIDISSPDAVSDSIRATPVEIRSPGVIQVKDLVYIFDRIGIQTLVLSNKIEEIELYMPSYKGDIGGFIDLISDASDLTFRSKSGSIIVDNRKNYIVQIEQQKDLTTIISDSIEKLGANDVFASSESGSISYSASTRNQYQIASYLKRISENTALIEMQIAIINVDLTEVTNSGFDWSALSLNLGEKSLFDIENGFGPKGELLSLSSSSAGLTISGGDFSLTSALNLLSSYGESTTEQNITLQTLSGVPVTIESGSEIPYIADIPVASNDSNTTSGIETETLKTGLKIALEALYDNDESMVTVDLDMSIVSLTGFRDLVESAEFGTISQPETQNQSLKNIIKLKAGDTALIGGLVINREQNDKNNLSFLKKLPTASEKVNQKRSAVFFMLRPTVTVYGGQ